MVALGFGFMHLGLTACTAMAAILVWVIIAVAFITILILAAMLLKEELRVVVLVAADLALAEHKMRREKMRRISITPRNNWQKAVENLGFGFHTTDVPYWNENAYYEFTMPEVLQIENATTQLWEMCLEAVQYVIDNDLFTKFCIPSFFVPHIQNSWNEDHASIYGRFDLVLNNGEIKLLEFNADTPTSIYEAGIVQWFWLQDFDKTKDQFNSIHEKLIDYWKYVKDYLHDGVLHFTCLKNSLEDLTTVEYMRDCAIQAGLSTKLIFIEDIGWDGNAQVFLDLEEVAIKNIFKLYPYEWMINEEFAQNILLDKNKTFWIEPSWKMILSNKAILPILWQLFPNHPLLLKASFDKNDFTSYAKKPILSREGANIQLVENQKEIVSTDGEYGSEGYIYQELYKLPNFENNYAVIGSWVIGQQSVGIGIRESDGLITNNLSRFVPHLIV
jgi:glutathionylspermidine synthase